MCAARPFQLPSRRRVLSKAAGTNAGELTTAPAIIVGPDTLLHDAARTMRERGVRRLVVVDDDHRVVGIVSRIDLLKAYMRDDAATKSDVEAIVRDVLWLRDISLEMHVKGGVVSIDGKVGRKSDADLIASLARRLAGSGRGACGHRLHTAWLDPRPMRLPCGASRLAGCRRTATHRPAPADDAGRHHQNRLTGCLWALQSPGSCSTCRLRLLQGQKRCDHKHQPWHEKGANPGMMASASSSGAKRVLRAAITAPTIATPERTANTA